MRLIRKSSAVVALGIVSVLASSGVASASLRPFPTLANELQMKRAAQAAGVDFGQLPCPENGIVNGVIGSTGVPGVGVGNCGVVQPVATSLPWPGPMAYAGGHVQVHPHEYVVFWGWGDSGAFPNKTCQPVTVTEPLRDGTSTTFTLPCDPDGAGKLMADLVAQMGGTQWAGSQTQYYETDASGKKTYVQNDKNVLAGVWVDEGDPAAGDNPNLKLTSSSNPVGPKHTYTALAAEASRAADHFGVAPADYIQSNFIIVQPAGYSDPNAEALGYCAFHDYTESDATGNSYYKDPSVKQGILGKSPGIAYTNMPYVLNQGAGCGAELVNSAADGGQLDGFTLALGHEIEETITDPGAEATVGNVTTTNSSNATNGGATFFGAWYDATDPNENGDKCAYVGELTSGFTPMPGQTGDIVGNGNERFAVQSLWSNSAAQGTGYCAGVSSSDLPDSVGSGEQPAPQGGTVYPENSQTVHPGVKPTPTCNATHLFADNDSDAPSMLSPDPSSGSTSGSQQDSLDIVQGDLAFGGGALTSTMTIKDLAAQASSPAKVNRYIVDWSQGATGYGAEVFIDGTGAISASAGTAANKYGDFTLPASAVKVTPGKRGTIVITIPVADIGNPAAGTVLSAVSMETVEAANAQVASLGYVVDQDTTTDPYLIGAPTCGATSTSGGPSPTGDHTGSGGPNNQGGNSQGGNSNNQGGNGDNQSGNSAASGSANSASNSGSTGSSGGPSNSSGKTPASGGSRTSKVTKRGTTKHAAKRKPKPKPKAKAKAKARAKHKKHHRARHVRSHGKVKRKTHHHAARHR